MGSRSGCLLPSLPDQAALVFHLESYAIAAVGENEHGDIRGKYTLVRLDKDSCDGSNHQHVGLMLAGRMQQRVQVANCLLDRVLGGPGVAPAEPGSVIGTDTRAHGDLWLHKGPIDGKGAAASNQNYCRCSLAGAVPMQLAAADVDQTARRRIRLWRCLLLCAGRSSKRDDDNGYAQERSHGRGSPLRGIRRLNQESSNKTDSNC